MQLTSAKNPLLREIRRALDRGSLTDSGLCVAESFHLLEEAIRSDRAIDSVIVSDSVRSTVERRIGGLSGVELIRVPDELFAMLSSTETSQGVIALVRPPQWDLDQIFRGKSLLILLDGVQDPGNAGAILRSAEAFGATGAIFIKGSVNPYNSKALRASAGSVFRLPLVYGIDENIIAATLTQRRVDVYAAMPRAQKMIGEVDLRRRCAFIIGSEGRGVSPMLNGVALDVRIPTHGVESLNAGVAAGVLLYEAWRQRQIAP